MYLHFIAVMQDGNGDFCYHFASHHSESLSRQRQQFLTATQSIKGSYGLHYLKTTAASFKSVQVVDPYFEHMVVYNESTLFINRALQSQQLTVLDLAAYVYQQTTMTMDELQNLLYGLDAAYLVKFNQPLFRATFVVTNTGAKIKALSSVTVSELQQNTSYQLKLASRRDGLAITTFINAYLQRYQSQSTDALNSQLLTDLESLKASS